MKYLKRTLLTLVFTPCFFLLSVITHEMGHVLSAYIFADRSASILIWPGVEIYPKIGDINTHTWPKKAIAMTHIKPKIPLIDLTQLPEEKRLLAFKSHQHVNALSDFEYAMTTLMGSGFNLLLSILALCLAFMLRKYRLAFYLLFPISLLFYDILSYTVLPFYFGLSHIVFWGSSNSEPIIALTKLGANPDVAAIGIMLVCAVQILFIFRLAHLRYCASRGK